MIGSTLGSVIRDYEHPTTDTDGRYTHQNVSDRGFAWQSYMLPADDGKLEVLASCMKHFGRLTPTQVRAGVLFQCVHGHCSG